MTNRRHQIEGHRARIDVDAESASPDLPAFIAKPAGAPPYHGFPLLPGSDKDGFVFGVITDPTGATWGDAYVVAPDGSRAGIVWSLEGPESEIVIPPDPIRWGVYQFRFDSPMEGDEDLIRNLHPRLAAAEGLSSSCGGDRFNLNWTARQLTRPNIAFEPTGWRYLRRAAGALEEFAPAARSNCRCAAAQRGR